MLGGLAMTSPILAQPTVYITGDMEKHTGTERVESSPALLRERTVTLHGAGNEVIAFQVIVQAYKDEADLDVEVSDLTGPARLEAGRHIRRYLAHYIPARDASYNWFPAAGAAVLPWRGVEWPDALVPLLDPYNEDHTRLMGPFSLDPARRRNQSVWIDVFIPKGTPAGDYAGHLRVLQSGRAFAEYTVTLEVHPFDLPDQTHVDGFGELYRETGLMFDTGQKFKLAPAACWPVYKRYIQMAHAHRFLALGRGGEGPLPLRPDGELADAPRDRWGPDWSLYAPYVEPILDGSLFTRNHGYRGPCAGAPPDFYPAPFVETFFGAESLRTHMAEHGGNLDPDLIGTWRANAAAFWKLVKQQGWQQTRFFAYILDEVDGPTALAPGEAERFHAAMARIQQALDQGTGVPGASPHQRRIHLIWTSHSDPGRWTNTDADLSDVISWWVPNGHALNPNDLGAIARQPGQTLWFYHSGHPAIGNHTINQLGIDLRLWGVLPARYPSVDGFFLWSVMKFPAGYQDTDFNPYRYPSYRIKETRWGNGTLFYPGSRLDMIGARRPIPGPVPSMRMKALRRGLQDYEYCWLARRLGLGRKVDTLLGELIEAAFSQAPEGREVGRWSQDPADWYRFRRRLAEWITQARQQNH